MNTSRLLFMAVSILLVWIPLRSDSIMDLVREGQKCANPDSALYYYGVALNTYHKNPAEFPDSSYVEALHSASQLLLNHFEDFNNGFYFLRKAERIAAKSPDTRQLSKIESSLADILSGIGNYNGAALNYQIALGMALKNKDWSQYTHSFIANSLNSVYIDSDKTLEGILREYPENQIPKSSISDFTLFLRNGIDCINNNDEPLALEYFDKALDLANNDSELKKYRLVPILLIYKTRRLFHGMNAAEQTVLDYLPTLENHDKTLAYNYLSNNFRNGGEIDKADHYLLLYYKRLAIKGFGVRYGDVWKAQNLTKLLDANYSAASGVAVPVPSSNMPWIVCGVLGIMTAVLLTICLRQRKTLLSVKPLNSGSVSTKEDGAEMEDSPESQEENEEELKEIYETLVRTMEETDEKYSPDFTLNRLASIAKIHPRKASKALNNYKGINFNSWLREVRTKEACRRLADTDTYGNLTISAIAEGLGFKSRTHFADVFKGVMGLSPSEYQKQQRSEN